jgi:Na+-translocating ferredoxin:NAD+ oxidoreductase RNF subunit RnfB
VKKDALSRREWLASLFGSRAQPPPAVPPPAEPVSAQPPQVAVIMGRFCLAYQGESCSVCLEQCPIPGAIVTERGLPSVDPNLCDGCGICIGACPAPQPAILKVTKRSGPGADGARPEPPPFVRPRSLSQLLKRDRG